MSGLSLLRAACAALLLALAAPGQAAPVQVTDDAGQVITLSAPARRIIAQKTTVRQAPPRCGSLKKVAQATRRHAAWPTTR